MRMTPMIAAAAIAALAAATPALAEDCNDQIIEERTAELLDMAKGDARKGAQLEKYMAEMHSDYGGNPSPEEMCEALAVVIEKMKQDG